MLSPDAFAGAIALLSSSWEPWLVVVPGLMIGLFAGATPGFQVSMAMAIVLPFTYYMDFLSAVLFLTAIFTGGGYGSSIPAILMNIPGSSAAVATAFDGYPMTRQGRFDEALGLALGASCIGAALSYLLLLLVISPLSTAVLKLGPSELFVIVLWGISLIALLSAESMVKGLLAGLVGLLLGTVGMSATGAIRGTFGLPVLLDGVPVVPAMIGLFAVSELFTLLGRSYIVDDEHRAKVRVSRIAAGLLRTVRYPVIVLRGSAIGALVGAVPGVGASVSNLVSYAETKRRSREPESFGRGNPRGVIASESANSSSEGGSMVTLLALGIPGGAGTAVLLAAFNIHNVTGGPRFILENMDVVYAIVLANFVQVVLLLVLGLGFIRLIALVVHIPVRVLVPTILALCVFGAYGITGSMSGPITVVIAGLLGWWMRRHGYPVAAAVVGLLLGRMAEGELIRTWQISGGQASYLLERPVTLILVALLVLSLFGGRLLRGLRRRFLP
ncbi:MAG: tripartite tricarboxylate transporter permease [Ectothiorhodospiraceae bacterium]|nr:tripartite tricarboxylate transporter permease [Chromatiales bacterium]MCP5155970.1 tripartite tricarboxylate transporter permease [Ectothiorhodospiraceae bacterium]